MKVQDILDYFKNRRALEKNDFIDNVHKSYETYRHIDPNYNECDISIIFENIENFYQTLNNKYKPTTVRNYLRHLSTSMDLPIITENYNTDLLNFTKDKIKLFIKEADKSANDYEKNKKPTTIIEKNIDNESLQLDINEIVPKDESISSSEITINNNENLIRLEIENTMLKSENTWLRKLIESMVLKI